MLTFANLRIDFVSSSSREADEGKPAKNTLKKTFTSLLSRMQIGKLAADGSSVTDTESLCENTSQWILDIAIITNITHVQYLQNCAMVLIFIIVFTEGKPGKKSFMYFASSAGRGFIISDDEEVTGVISVRNKESLLRFKIFISCLGCCMCSSCIISRVPQF